MRGKTTPDLYNEALSGGVRTDQEHRERLCRYSNAKRHQQTVINYIQNDPVLRKEFARELKALLVCGVYLIFKEWLATGYIKLVGGFSCQKHLLCKPCSLRRSSKYLREYAARIMHVLKERPNLRLYLVTRTVANGSDLLERFDHLGKRIHKGLMNRRRQSISSRSTSCGRVANSVMRHIVGSVGTYEIGRGENSGLWHPHSHEIVLVEPVFEHTEVEVPGWKRDPDTGLWNKVARKILKPFEFQRRLSEEYLDISGDSNIVDIRLIDCFDDNGFFNQELLFKALCEVFKYSLKFGDLSFEDQIYVYRTLKGRRLLFSYGCLRGVKVTDYLNDADREKLEVGPYVYRMYKFLQNDYSFHKFLDSEEFEEMQEAAAAKGRVRNLRRREERIKNAESSVLLKNGLRIDGEKIRKHLESRKPESSVPF